MVRLGAYILVAVVVAGVSAQFELPCPQVVENRVYHRQTILFTSKPLLVKCFRSYN